MRLLLTRPEPDCERTAAALRALGHEVLRMPLMRIETVADPDLGEGPWRAVFMTSANAARAIAAHPRCRELLPLPVLTVGRRTAEAARDVGFSSVTSADGNVQDLARLAAVRFAASRLPLLYLAGEKRAGDLEGALGAHDLAVRTTVVYRAVAETQFSSEVRSALAAGDIDGVLHFSKRGAEAFLAAAEAARLLSKCLPLKHYCLSAQVATPLLAAQAPAVVAASQPEEQLFLDLIGRA